MLSRERATQIHQRTFNNREDIAHSRVCGCIYCGAMFPFSEVRTWYEGDAPKECTAACPQCGIDAVIGDSCGVSIRPELLAEMHAAFFER